MFTGPRFLLLKTSTARMGLPKASTAPGRSLLNCQRAAAPARIGMGTRLIGSLSIRLVASLMFCVDRYHSSPRTGSNSQSGLAAPRVKAARLLKSTD